MERGIGVSMELEALRISSVPIIARPPAACEASAHRYISDLELLSQVTAIIQKGLDCSAGIAAVTTQHRLHVIVNIGLNVCGSRFH